MDQRSAGARFSEVAAETFVASTCFKTGPPVLVGIELEWLLHHRADPTLPLSPDDLALATRAGDVLTAGRLTVEPGGQLELSSEPFCDPVTGFDRIEGDAAALRAALAPHGLALAGIALDPHRVPVRVLDTPRYAAMERYFDRTGPAGRTMMSSTAAVQLNLDAGEHVSERWDLLHELTPVLVAAFANSPVLTGPGRGTRSGRAAVWAAIDRARTRPVRSASGADPRVDWVNYVMSAPLLCLRNEGPNWDAPFGLTFRDWLRGSGPRPATRADLTYHLTTLFPPVRPRGHLELRVLDAQRTEADTAAAFALVWALCTDPAGADAARAALAPVPPDDAVLRRARRDGVADPALAVAARACFAAAWDSLGRLDVTALQPALADFLERYTERGRCPADDTLDDLLAGAGGTKELTCPAPRAS